MTPKYKKQPTFPTLGIVLPVRNSMHFLPETLGSLKKQTESSDCIVLSDNSSVDGSPEILKCYAESNQIATYATTPEYLEFGASFNFAASYCHCDWIYFLHSDDILSKYAIHNIKKAISNVDPSVAMISFKAEIINEKSKLMSASFPLTKKKYEFGNKFISNNLGTSSINFAGVVINRKIFDLVGGFEPTNSYWLDLKYYHKIVKEYKILRMPKAIVRYRTYSYERDGDERVNFTQKNQIYWQDDYLPNLFKNNPGIRPVLRSRQSRYFYYLKFFVNYFPKRLIQLLLKRFRIFLDVHNLGNFSDR